MKQLRGEARKLLIVIGTLQDKIGAARGYHEADTDPNGFVKAQELLSDAFDLCVATTSRYEQVTDKASDAP